MKARRHHMKRGKYYSGSFTLSSPQVNGVETRVYEDGSVVIEGRIGHYTRVGNVVNITLGRRLFLREKRASRATR